MSEGRANKLEPEAWGLIVLSAIQGSATLGPRGDGSHYARDLRQRGNVLVRVVSTMGIIGVDLRL